MKQKINQLYIQYYVETSQYFIDNKSIFVSSAGKTKSVQEFKPKPFEFLLYCRLSSCKNHKATCNSFHRA